MGGDEKDQIVDAIGFALASRTQSVMVAKKKECIGEESEARWGRNQPGEGVWWRYVNLVEAKTKVSVRLQARNGNWSKSEVRKGIKRSTS